MAEFETFEHGADVGIRGYGKTREEALSNLLKALSTLLVENPLFLQERPVIKIPLKVTSELPDELLVNFVNKVLTLSALEGAIFYEFQGKIEENEAGLELEGEVMGVPFDSERFGLGVEVKGATFTLARFEKEKDLYVAQCVVDV